MSQESPSGNSPEPRWEPPLEFEIAELEADAVSPPEEQPVVAVAAGSISSVALPAAGAAAINFLLTVACTAAWMMNEQMALDIIAASNGLWLLLGMVAIGLGAYIQRQQKKAGVKGGKENIIASLAVVSGMFVMCAAVLLPLLSAMRAMVSTG